MLWLVRNRAPARTQRRFRLAQTASAAAMSLGHGLQDAQKTMGIIVLALVAGGFHTGTEIPLWVKLSSALAISLGTYSGGWRIMRTLGRKIIELDPARGFVAESVASLVLYGSAYWFHAPVSTTHTITSAIMGVGATKRALGRPLGRRQEHRLRLGADHPRGRSGRGGRATGSSTRSCWASSTAS